MRKISFIAIGLCVVFISACNKKNLPDKEETVAKKVSNEWWVVLSESGNPLTHEVKLSTYNTASNPDSIWIDDLENIWEFKVKAKVDLNNLTFSTDKSQNEYYNITVKIANGKILPGAAKSQSGNKTDSIYMEAEFSDDPGTKYVIAGHARTMFSEDEY